MRLRGGGPTADDPVSTLPLDKTKNKEKPSDQQIVKETDETPPNVQVLNESADNTQRPENNPRPATAQPEIDKKHRSKMKLSLTYRKQVEREGRQHQEQGNKPTDTLARDTETQTNAGTAPATHHTPLPCQSTPKIPQPTTHQIYHPPTLTLPDPPKHPQPQPPTNQHNQTTNAPQPDWQHARRMRLGLTYRKRHTAERKGEVKEASEITIPPRNPNPTQSGEERTVNAQPPPDPEQHGTKSETKKRTQREKGETTILEKNEHDQTNATFIPRSPPTERSPHPLLDGSTRRLLPCGTSPSTPTATLVGERSPLPRLLPETAHVTRSARHKASVPTRVDPSTSPARQLIVARRRPLPPPPDSKPLVRTPDVYVAASLLNRNATAKQRGRRGFRELIVDAGWGLFLAKDMKRNAVVSKLQVR